MSGAVRMPGENTKLEKMFCCGACKTISDKKWHNEKKKTNEKTQ